MAKKQSHTPATISNRRARHDYELGDSLIVGVVLTGRETKALRMGLGQLRGAYVTLRGNELWLINATITGTGNVRLSEEEQTQARKLLAKRKEIEALAILKNQGRTIVPLEILTKGRYIKLRIAAGKGKKLYDKRQTLKRREEERGIQAKLKHAKI